MAIKPQTHIYFGADYYPEQWDRTIWHEDIRLMKSAGVNLVSLGIFAWALLQPAENQFQWNWLDEVMDLMADNGIQVDLATATASPPAWLIQAHPEILPVDRWGHRYRHGSRQHYCPNSPEYRNAAAEFVRHLATRYARHPALAMWHVNNEYGCHIAECYCERCQTAFQGWLKRRYETIDELNARWGTAFWSQWYSDWTQIPLPGLTPTFGNPGQQLDYARFMSDSLYECFENEATILREATPNVPVTTNFMGLFKPVNYFRWAPGLDVVSWDSYPDPVEAVPVSAALAHDLMRGLKGGQPFILMEQTPSAVNWRQRNLIKPPGVMRLWSYQTVAHGGDGILYFQWRASRAGAEKFHGAVVGHHGSEHARVFREVAELGHELSRMSEVVGSRIVARVAILFDWENWWALELPSKPNNDMRYLDRVLFYYRALWQKNIAVDIIHPSAPWDSYDVVIMPALYLFPQSYQENVMRFVARGGTLVADYFSGIVDENDRVHLGGYPQPLTDVLGIMVEEFYPLAPEDRVAVRDTRDESGDVYYGSLWAEQVNIGTARPIAVFHDHFFAGSPAVTVNAWGQGQAYYVATQLDDVAWERVLRQILDQHQLRPPLDVPEGVEVTVRQSDHQRYYFLLNHRPHPVSITLPEPMTRLADRQVLSRIELNGWDATVLVGAGEE